MINIAGLTPVNDPAYRYKMPKLVGKVEGKGNGIKTVLSNVNDLSLALKRDAAEITKFFGCELGAQTTFAADRAIVNGAHRDNDLQTQLSKYIENFVLCKNCHLPETHYKIKEGMISQKCLACGHKESVDMRHKLTTFILNQHKKAKELAKKEGKKEDKDGKKDKKEKKEKEEASGEKKEKSKKKSKSDEVGDTVFSGMVESAAAEGETAEEEEAEPESKIVEDSIELFKTFLSQNPGATPAQQVDELRNITTIQALKPADRITIFLGTVCAENFVAANTISSHTEVLKALANGEIQQRQLLASLEWLCGVKFPVTSRLIAKVFMQLYDADVIEEDVFLTWAADTVKNDFSVHDSMFDYDSAEGVHMNAAPFIKWLQEAEEEGEEGEEEEDEDDDEEEDEDEGDSA